MNVLQIAVLLALSLVSCFVGFKLEVTLGNVGHVAAGRRPNAGAALLPNIPLVPLTYIAAAWVVDSRWPGFGLPVLATWSVVSITLRCMAQRRAVVRLRSLMEARGGEAPRG